jgi:hypothetical protein
MSLPNNERADLAYRLIASLEPADLDVDVSAQWAAEIDRRRQSYLLGQARSFEAAETLQRIEQRLDQTTESGS